MDNRYMSQLRVGMHVKSLDGKELGRVRDVGSTTFDVEKGIFLKRAFAATFDEIARIEREGVVLDLSTREISRMKPH